MGQHGRGSNSGELRGDTQTGNHGRKDRPTRLGTREEIGREKRGFALRKGMSGQRSGGGQSGEWSRAPSVCGLPKA